MTNVMEHRDMQNRSRPSSSAVVALLATGLTTVACLMSAGCATLKSSVPTKDDVAVERRQRNEEVVRQFEAKRDFAELQAAGTKWREGDSAGAKLRLRQILERNPANVDAAVLLAEVLLSEDRPEESVELLAPLAESEPDNALVQHTLDVMLEAVDQRTAGEFSQISDVPIAEGAGGSGIRQVAAFSADLHGPNGGVAIGGSTVLAGDTGGMPLIQEGSQSLACGDEDTARACFEKCISENPDNLQIAISAAVASLRYNRPTLAIGLLEPLRERAAGSAPFWRVMAMAYYRRGDFKASQTALEQALSLDKSNALSYFLLGSTLSKLGQSEAAEASFREAERLDPRYAGAR